MIKIGVIGRNVPGKGIEIVNEILEFEPSLDVTFILFTDMFELKSESNSDKILYRGWQTRAVVWSENFDALLLPMSAPETFSYVLHESILLGLPLFINEKNESLKTQLDFAYFYNSLEELSLLIKKFSGKTEALVPAKTKRIRNIWNRII